MKGNADTDTEDDIIDVSEISELDAGFFAEAILVRAGENLIDQVRLSRAFGLQDGMTRSNR